MTAPGPRSGILVLDKDAGPTSFDLVALVRRRLGVRRVGHAGTLDPAAVGVLPILIAEATKLMPYLADQDKEYRATVRFGIRTDTQDLTGRVLSESQPADLTEERVQQASRRFVGAIDQVPPMYSAVHQGGRRLYELAREGVEVERRPRRVQVHSITVECVVPPTAVLRIVCGKGTYVRALVADLGDVLGCGAAVESLARLRVGPFRREDALPAGDLERLPAAAIWARVRPPETALTSWPAVLLDQAGTRSFLNGQPATIASPPEWPAGHVAVRGHDGRFLGVGAMAVRGIVRPERIIHADRPGPHVLHA
jgi:tRNA pseudouridine55 synthase